MPALPDPFEGPFTPACIAKEQDPSWLQFKLRTRRLLLPTTTIHLTRFWIISPACQRVVGLDALLLWFASIAKALPLSQWIPRALSQRRECQLDQTYLAVGASDSATFRCLDGTCTGAISVSVESTVDASSLSRHCRPALVLSMTVSMRSVPLSILPARLSSNTPRLTS